MYLFEEYYKRHGIQSLQFFYNNFSVVLKCNEINHIFRVNWINDFRRPGFFKIYLKVVNHNGYEKDDLFNYIMEENKELNEYENFMFEFFKNIKIKNKSIKVANKKEATMIMWESFAYALENHFSKQSSEIKNNLAISLNKELPYQDRLFNQILLLQKFSNNNIGRIWKNDFNPILENYSTWIEKILEPSVIQNF